MRKIPKTSKKRMASNPKRKISKASIKKIIKNGSDSDVIITGKAADAIARMLEKRAKLIAKYAVKRAKGKRRNTVTEEDIDAYRLRFGD